ncbi:hypothetical protein SUGI_0592000 [Cryptomeria japonica]|nr:hypothetical protein SUGI_0592000 [Cryptomeria japonica]
MQVLIDFKAGLNDPDNLLAKWNENKGNQDPCKWDHVSCNENGSVIGLDLGDTKISGPISPGLGYLNSLQNLDLHNSSFNGSLPDTLGYPMFLSEIDVSLNQLTGSIPITLNQLSGLNSFNVSNNHLSGPIPIGGVIQRFGVSSFEGNPDLCGPPLPKNC